MEQAATQRTPQIEISGAGCRIVGECYPENIQEFSSPVMSSLRSLVPDSGSYTVDMELFYFNSSSAKFLFDFFERRYQVQAGRRRIIFVHFLNRYRNPQ